VLKLPLRRTILFVRDLALLTSFCRDVLGLTLRKGSAREGWVDFDLLALHRRAPRRGSTKIVFFASNVAKGRADEARSSAK